MNLKEIKQAIEEGKKVYWSNTRYEVIKTICKHTGYTDFLISCDNGHCIGLTWADNTTMNGKEQDFFTN